MKKERHLKQKGKIQCYIYLLVLEDGSLSNTGKVIERIVASSKNAWRHCHVGAASRSLLGLQRVAAPL